MDVQQLSTQALRRITRSLDVHSRALLHKYHLTGPQLSVLKELGRHNHAPIGALAKATFLGAPTVTGVVDRLEKQGWVTRLPGTDDRRQVLISISPAGKRILAQNPPLLLEALGHRLGQLPKAEQRQICDVLQAVANIMEQSAINGEDE